MTGVKAKLILSLFVASSAWCADAIAWCSPSALAASADGKVLYVACATSNRVEVFDTENRTVARSFAMPAPATGLVLSPEGDRLYVTCAAPRSTVQVVETSSGRVLASIAAGHTAQGPVLDAGGRTLYVSNRYSHDVSVIDTVKRREVARIPVLREPVGSALSRDAKRLVVANSLPTGRADVAPIAAEISLIDTAARKAVGKIALPNGSTSVREIRISPDGRLAAVTHLLARYYLPTTQIDRGWIQTNAFSLIDVDRGELVGTVLLDETDRGAANPWAVDWSDGGKSLLITHAGTHEVSIIDVPGMLRKLQTNTLDPADDMSFLTGLRLRVRLAGNGPRALAVNGKRAWIASYFSDTLETLDLTERAPAASTAAALTQSMANEQRLGERLFNDGSISFQGWLSCVSCHSPDARVDGLNWDLLNDGIGNPKNARSLLLSHRTPPAMSHSVRESAEQAVRAGIRHILFETRPESEAAAMDAYLKSLQPVPSPWLVNGKLSSAARRGRKLFFDKRVACGTCHPEGLFTDLKPYDVGTDNASDTSKLFDTPTLVEIWRTAPYLHDGSAATMHDVLTTANRGDRHGKTSHLNAAQIQDLIAYLMSL